MPYQSFFSGNSGGAPASSGGGYKSFFGTATIAEPTPSQLQQLRQQKQQQKAQTTATPAPKPQSLLSKFGSAAKSFAKAATAGEQKFAEGAARVLPGGASDLAAQQKQAQAQQAAEATYAGLHKAGKISDAAYQKAVGRGVTQSQQLQKEVAQTQKAMPTKTQIGLGAASTAADILTAGQLPEIKGLAAGGKAATAARVGTQLAANATAGGLNAAAAGGTKGDIIKNAAAGALLPEVLHQGGQVIGKGASKLLEETTAGQTALKNAKVNKLLTAAEQPPKIKAEVNQKLVQAGHVSPKIEQTPMNELTLGHEAAGKKIDQAKVNQYVKQIQDGEPIQPVVVRKEGGKTTVIDGQHRMAAAQKLGITDVPTVEKISEAPIPTAAKEAAAVAPKETTAAPAETTPTTPKPTATPVEKAPAATVQPELRTSGSALNAEAKAVQQGLTKEFADKAQYKAGSFKDEAAKAVDLVKSDPQKALDIATGKVPGDNTIHEVAVSRALENKALKEGDVETLRQLAKSPRHAVTSEAAQRLGAEGYGEKDSVVKSMAKLQKVRQDAFEKRTGKTATKAVSDEVKAIRAAKPKVTVQSWSEFIDGIKC